jgi:hypothetical protein
MRTTLTSLFTAALVVATLSSCTTTTVSLDYLPNPARGIDGPAQFAVGAFVDQRGVQPTSIGRVNVPGISNITEVPLEHVHLSLPASEAVRNAFGHALEARKMLVKHSSPRFLITGEIIDLHCEVYEFPYARVVLRVNVVDARTGRIIHTKEHTSSRQAVFPDVSKVNPVPQMRDVTARALQDAVDLALDDKELRAAIK